MTQWSGGAPVAREPVLVSIGDIGVSQNWVYTPSGARRGREVQWMLSDLSHTTDTIPAWAIVMTVVFVWFCLLGLLFLLAKERRTVGVVQVVVYGPGLAHTVMLPVHSRYQVEEYHQRVNYARAVCAAGW